MNIEKDKIDEILKKSVFFNNVKNKLKTEYVGLDEIIDEICNVVESWYVFPNAQIRPTVVNLWGLTGVGKTSLIVRLFELLEFNSVLRFDVGEWVNKSSDFQLTEKISGQLNTIKKDKQIPIFIFDEFQLGRTIDEEGNEIDRPSTRIIWDLLDTGKFNIIEEHWEITNIIKLYKKLQYLLYDKKIKVIGGKIIGNKEEWDKMFLDDEDDDDDEDFDALKKFYPNDAFVPLEKLWSLKSLNDKFYSEMHIAEYLLTLNGDEILTFIEKTVENSYTPVEHDFSTSIIFNIGNLDSAYYDTHEMSPDIDADTLYDETKKITLSDIKSNLTSLYRPEQISRLGNNHVIYKSLNKQMYKDIIKLELDKVTNKIIDKFDIRISFDDSMYDIIYNEAVFPTQGVRPIFSTITSLIESYVGRIIVDILKNKIQVERIYWEYIDGVYNIHLFLEENTVKKKILKYEVSLKIDNIRKSKSDDIQALVGIHEAGHVITSVYALNILPKSVLSRTADGKGGVTFIELPDYETKEMMLNQIVMLIAGYTAEKMIFGEDNLTSGSYSDLETTTKKALLIVKEYGMNGTPIQYSHPDFRISDSLICLNDDDLDKKAIDIIEECEKKTKRILEDNKELLLRMGEHLTNNSKMVSEEIKNMVEKFGKNKPEYKTKDDYYNYKSILTEEIKKLNGN